jgi:UDP-glucose 4-epimerase
MADTGDLMRGKKVLITAGLGMIGSAIALKAIEWGCHVTIVDACIEPYGANLFNVDAIRDQVKVEIADIRDKEAMKGLVKGQDIIFNLAGQVSHNDSMDQPFLDADINYIGHLNVLECVRHFNPEAVILHAGSRLQFGRIEKLPVDEKHPLNPRTPYALNKAAAENMYLFYNQIHQIRCVLFRIANPYGPRSQMRHSKYSMVNWFLRQAMDNQTIKVFGDGSQVRDYIFVDDLAEAFLQAAVTKDCWGEVFNVGSGIPLSFRNMADCIVNIVGRGRVELVPWPEDYINVETGDYFMDITKISKMVEWKPETGFVEGVQRTYDFYQKNRARYWQV